MELKQIQKILYTGGKAVAVEFRGDTRLCYLANPNDDEILAGFDEGDVVDVSLARDVFTGKDNLLSKISLIAKRNTYRLNDDAFDPAQLVFPIIKKEDILVMARLNSGLVTFGLTPNKQYCQKALNAAVGCLKWRVAFSSLGNLTGACVGIYDAGMCDWIDKAGVGDTADEAFLSACETWGIGRELWALPALRIDAGAFVPAVDGADDDFANGFHVAEIMHNERGNITSIAIADRTGKTVCSWLRERRG